MSASFLNYYGRSGDVQDGHERHVWSKKEYISNGSIIKVKGTDTEDEEANVMVFGAADFKLKDDTDSEVILFGSSSDTQMKFAMLTIPRDKQRRWPEDEGGIQHPTDPDFALHFSGKLAHITKNKFAVGEKGELEVKGGDVYVRGRLIVEKEVVANKLVKTPEIVNGTEQIPGFQGNKQEEKKSAAGGAGSGASSGGGAGGGGGGGGGGSVSSATMSLEAAGQLTLDFSGVPTQLSLNLFGGA